MFKKGDKLRVVRAFKIGGVDKQVGDIVTFDRVREDFPLDCYIEESSMSWQLDRFELHGVKRKKAPGKDNALVAYLRSKGLSRSDARKAYNNTLMDCCGVRSTALSYVGRSLSSMFLWRDTPEGDAYWRRLNHKHFQ